MRVRSAGKVVMAILAVVGVCGLYWLSGDRGRQSGPPPAVSQPSSVSTKPSTNYQLADEFVRWYETQYVKGMRVVGGMSTDVEDSIKKIGEAETVNRYASLRRITLDYAMRHPDEKEVPSEDLDRIGEMSYQRVVADAMSSTKWIDYKNEKLKKGVVESYRQGARVWIPFYRKLLAVQVPDGTTDFRDLLRLAFSREDYARIMEQSTKDTLAFHAALKEGIPWYAPWALWTKSMIDKACQQDIAICRSTVEAIYGK